MSLTSAAALRAAADKLTPLIYPKQQTSKNLTAERIATKHAAADRAFCADPLAKSPCSSAARRSFVSLCLRVFLFRRGHCGTVPRASQRPKNCRLKLLYTTFATVPRRNCFLFNPHYLRHMYAPIFLFSVDLRKFYFQ